MVVQAFRSLALWPVFLGIVFTVDKSSGSFGKVIFNTEACTLLALKSPFSILNMLLSTCIFL